MRHLAAQQAAAGIQEVLRRHGIDAKVDYVDGLADDDLDKGAWWR